MFIASGVRGRSRRGERTEQTTGLHGGNHKFTGRKLMQGARSTNAERPPHNCGAGVQYMRSEGSACIFDGTFNMKAKSAHHPFLMQRYKKIGGNARISPTFFNLNRLLETNCHNDHNLSVMTTYLITTPPLQGIVTVSSCFLFSFTVFTLPLSWASSL